LVFDAEVRLDFNAAHEIDVEIAPTEAHWNQLKVLVFSAVAVSNTNELTTGGSLCLFWRLPWLNYISLCLF